MYYKDRSEDKTLAWQNQGTDTRTDMSNSRQNCTTGSDAPWTVIMKRSQDGKNGKIMTSRQISCAPERLGIDIQ